ncbi:hypothetical protein ACFQV2_34965 [Actinokineospora soli]|uniref:SnoaL-like domain-containing protein n=1 Tax=Actinokineospora soli TaxID=1048753 RepID=A0ABW2TVE4_9PSEU
MDRPRTGRRRVRSGAVRATEIIDRATRRFPRAPLPPADDDATAELAAVPADDDAPPSGRRTAKLVGLALSALTLCGTVAAAAVVSRERGSALPAQASPITGQRALLPDELTDAVSGSLPARPTAQPPRTAASTEIVGRAPGATGQDGTAPAADGPAPPPRTDGLSDAELVTEYYRLVRSDPGNAFGLLSGTAFGADLGGFVDAWAGVTDVKLTDITTTADGVVADVRILLASGRTLWVRQLFDVTESTPRRIAGVTLLSAQVS